MTKKEKEVIIDVEDLTKEYDGRKVVSKVSLHVNKGEVFGFLGPNGSGKTTTIRMLCGLLTPDSGHGFCLGYDILTESSKIKEQVGYMTQRFSLYAELSIEENLNFMAGVYEVVPQKQKVMEALEQLGLVDRRKQLAGSLSGGWKQRLSLAACLIHNPQLLLLDEPTAGVDPIARREFWDKIHLLSEQGVTTLISTHYMDEAERCTRLAYLAYGELLITGSVDEIIGATQLVTWEISGHITTSLLQKIKKLDAVVQAALFGNQIHVCAYDKSKVEKELSVLAKEESFRWQLTPTTLEDAFISLVNKDKPAGFVGY